MVTILLFFFACPTPPPSDTGNAVLVPVRDTGHVVELGLGPELVPAPPP